ncbi:MAG: coniferyl-aldehyde dehydrogenase, partial [Gammaproteobacteria bacterium]
MQALFDTLHAHYRKTPFPGVRERRQWLLALERCLIHEQKAFAQAIEQDFGHRAVSHTQLVDVLPSVLAVRHAKRHLARWMRPRRARLSPLFWPS